MSVKNNLEVDVDLEIYKAIVDFIKQVDSTLEGSQFTLANKNWPVPNTDFFSVLIKNDRAISNSPALEGLQKIPTQDNPNNVDWISWDAHEVDIDVTYFGKKAPSIMNKVRWACNNRTLTSLPSKAGLAITDCSEIGDISELVDASRIEERRIITIFANYTYGGYISSDVPMVTQIDDVIGDVTIYGENQ